MIPQSKAYNFHRLDLTRQVGFIVTVYDEDGLRLATTEPCPAPAAAFAEGRKIVDNKVEGPRQTPRAPVTSHHPARFSSAPISRSSSCATASLMI